MGMNLSDRLAQRSELLELAVRFARYARSRIEYAAIPPDRLVTEFDCPEKSFFDECRCNLKACTDFHSAWRKTIESSNDVPVLSVEERALLLELGSSLGSCDLEGQLMLLEGFIDSFQRLSEYARQIKMQNSRVYLSCSALFGALAALVII